MRQAVQAPISGTLINLVALHLVLCNAGIGKPVTLVLTDVEGSTALWEWNHAATDEAINVHDHVMRSLLTKYHGYEITTEGDAFLLALHEPTDAVAWCMATQQVLWSHVLFGSPAGTVESRVDSV